jgi:hypothetical protein
MTRTGCHGCTSDFRPAALQQKLAEAARNKQELTELIVHDLKNPIATVLSNVEYALGAQALSESRSLRAHLSPTDLSALIEQVRGTMARRTALEARTVTVESPVGPVCARVDPDLLGSASSRRRPTAGAFGSKKVRPAAARSWWSCRYENRWPGCLRVPIDDPEVTSAPPFWTRAQSSRLPEHWNPLSARSFRSYERTRGPGKTRAQGRDERR